MQKQLLDAIAENKAARDAQRQLILRSRYFGRLSSFLDRFDDDSEEQYSAQKIVDVESAISDIKEKIDSEEVRSRLATILSFIGEKMTEYSKDLELEYAGSSLRLDLGKLTVIANTENGPIPLERIGSGENWVSYHVISHLALHWWFRRRDRPVPGFLIFDQPTQAYYPPDIEGGGVDQLADDADRRAVKALFKLMWRACKEFETSFQLIVLDHAHLRDDWFESSIVEEWRGNNALVPVGWRSG